VVTCIADFLNGKSTTVEQQVDEHQRLAHRALGEYKDCRVLLKSHLEVGKQEYHHSLLVVSTLTFRVLYFRFSCNETSTPFTSGRSSELKMLNFRNLPIQLLAAASYASALPFSSLFNRAVINHDAVVGFPQTVPSGLLGTLYLKYKPFLEVYNGCVPFPAVNAAGDTSGGLATSGSSNGMCGSNTGQVYIRSGTYNGAFAIMYSWYMPKDSPSSGLGHRHDWENVVVWLSSASESATLRGVAISAHGRWC
jgi:hypothetical protein